MQLIDYNNNRKVGAKVFQFVDFDLQASKIVLEI